MLYKFIGTIWLIIGFGGLILKTDFNVVAVCFALSGLFYIASEMSLIRLHMSRILGVNKRTVSKNKMEGVNNVDQTQQHNL